MKHRGRLVLTYNQAGRVSGAYLGNKLPPAWYTYDVWGRRIAKYGSLTKHFHYDLNGNLIAETGSDGSLIKAYIRLNGRPIAQITADGSIYYYHTDHLGTPQKMTDQAGTVVWAADYLPFGAADVTVETVSNNLRFMGQYYDWKTGLHYNWHRYYDPDTGRYVTADPIGLSGGINLYAYAFNDPVNLVDPQGKSPLIPILISILIVGDSVADYYGTHEESTFIDPSCNVTVTDKVSITPSILPIQFDYEMNSQSTGEVNSSIIIRLPGASWEVTPREPINMLDNLLGPINFNVGDSCQKQS